VSNSRDINLYALEIFGTDRPSKYWDYKDKLTNIGGDIAFKEAELMALREKWYKVHQECEDYLEEQVNLKRDEVKN